MPGATANLPKTSGHALLVGGESCCEQPRRVLAAIGYHAEQTADPYAAMLELCRRPLVYRALVLSLQSLYRDELSVITTVRRRFPHVSIWLAHTDGRQAALAESMRLGAEALIDESGVHPLADEPTAAHPPRPLTFRPVPTPADEPAEANIDVDAPQPEQSNGDLHRGESNGHDALRGHESLRGPIPNGVETNGIQINGVQNNGVQNNGRAKARTHPNSVPPPSPGEPVLTAAELRALLGDATN